jgi:uncharacterized cupin superfamily protein
MKNRPDIIKNWREIEPQPVSHPSGETFGIVADFGAATGLSRLRVVHFRLRPGERTNPPIMARDMEGFAFVLEGAPDLFIDGYLHRLKEGHGMTLADRSGTTQTFLNNTDRDARLFLVGEPLRFGSKFRHPLPGDEAADENLKNMGLFWVGAPVHKIGPHDGRTDAQRGSPSAKGSLKRALPDFVSHWRDALGPDRNNTYPASKEKHGIDAPYGKRARLSRVGVHLEVLKPGRRTSWPHAERDEEEFAFVVSGNVDCWLDGRVTPMWAGDIVGWEGRTGITHVIINNSDDDAVLIVGGEASRLRNQFWYPFHPGRNRAIGALCWKDHPKPDLGPHDGLPDRLRESLPAAARRSATAANEAARKFGLRKVTKRAR